MTFWKPAALNTTENIPETKRKAGASSSGRGMRKNRYAPDAIANAGSVRTDPGKARSGAAVPLPFRRRMCIMSMHAVRIKKEEMHMDEKKSPKTDSCRMRTGS